MNQPPILIKQISQLSNTIFTILWSDGLKIDYRLGALQQSCPCAKCYDPIARKQIIENQQLDLNVRAKSIVNVGRYALKILFTSGCSKGIYSFALLRHLAKENANV